MTRTRPSPPFHRPRPFALTAGVCFALVMLAPGARAAEEPSDAAPAADAQGVSLFDNTGGGRDLPSRAPSVLGSLTR